jgi:hypothetical protein
MSRFLFPLFLIALGGFGLVEHRAVTAQWTAMYPNDPDRQVALQHCFEDNHQFNRLSPAARSFCYEKYLPEIAAARPLFMAPEAGQSLLIAAMASNTPVLPAPELQVQLVSPAKAETLEPVEGIRLPPAPRPALAPEPRVQIAMLPTQASGDLAEPVSATSPTMTQMASWPPPVASLRSADIDP